MDAIRSALLRRVLAAYRSRLERRFGARVRSVRLFGSWARGDATQDSDIDVAIVIDGLTREEWREAVAIGAELDETEGTCMAPFAVSTDHFQKLVAERRGIARAILEEGIPA